MHKTIIFASRFVSVLVTILLLACQTGGTLEVEQKDCTVVCPAPEPTIDAGSQLSPYGSRLAPLWRTYADGTKVLDPTRLWDSQREEACSFTRIEGGPARCLPRFEWNAHPGVFADNACSKPVATFPACKELPRYVRDELAAPWQTCEPPPLAELFPLGDSLPVGAALYDMSSGICETHASVDTLNAALPLLEPVGVDAFVDGSEGP